MSGTAIDIVKRAGKRPPEPLHPPKLAASIKAACLSARSPDGEAELAAQKVTHAVLVWCTDKPTVTSHDLRRIATIHLRTYHPDAAYLYEHYRNII